MDKVWLNHYPEHINKEMEIPDKSVPDMLQETIANYGDQSALYFYGKEITYKKLGELSSAFASVLQEEGVKKGDRVALMLPNCPQYVISYYGALQAGAIVTQINPMLVGKELEYILTDSGAETIVIYEPLLPVLNKIQDKTSAKRVVKVNLEGRNTEDDIAIGFDTFLKKAKKSLEPVAINSQEDVAILQYTGGTTGRSKGTMLTHKNLLANVMQTYEYFKDAFKLGKERFLTVIPLFHVYGMTSCMNLSIYTGAMSIMLPRFELEEVLQTIKDLQPTSFPGVPTMYIGLINHPKVSEYGLDSIEICNTGSAPMPKEILRTFEEKTGADILEGYGLTETAPTTHCNPYFGKRKPGSVGIGVPSTDYKIVDLADGESEMPVGETGEVLIKGPQVMKGYWNMPEETAQTLQNGWLYTGDIAYVDEEGYLFIVDRKKDLIIASGYNVYPRDVEEVIYEHPSVQEAVVVGVPDPYRGETVKAVVVLKENQHCDEKELIAFCRENLAAYKVPRIIEFRNELPKTSVGKILRRKIREELV
ncbi:long-chain fatty acid--CoA ligase [Virgibacillus sp. NKC19-16]|uniref:long-chain-fatty-acid--CoA ligase n=1 Tax=Virgibacillus salidurans TaxID=2831673 RepID=UPI001F3E8E00|nr:long-chain fatty acid--CoA ligase [Virgibacillus sp. NKC19-16]UJL45538.1 long-chain fatty acid--CoA ligase [Virgibacillus sp. NKC19-16]